MLASCYSDLKQPSRVAFMKWHVQSLWLGITQIAKQSHQASAGGTGVQVSSLTLLPAGPVPQVQQVAQSSVWALPWVHQGSPRGWESPTTQGSVPGMLFQGTSSIGDVIFRLQQQPPFLTLLLQPNSWTVINSIIYYCYYAFITWLATCFSRTPYEPQLLYKHTENIWL